MKQNERVAKQSGGPTPSVSTSDKLNWQKLAIVSIIKVIVEYHSCS